MADPAADIGAYDEDDVPAEPYPPLPEDPALDDYPVPDDERVIDVDPEEEHTYGASSPRSRARPTTHWEGSAGSDFSSGTGRHRTDVVPIFPPRDSLIRPVGVP